MKSNYHDEIKTLIDADVPKWFIREYLLRDKAYTSNIYIYYDTEEEWYTVLDEIISSDSRENLTYCGELTSLGFPTLEEYKLLIEEGQCLIEYLHRIHRKLWIMMREQEV